MSKTIITHVIAPGVLAVRRARGRGYAVARLDERAGQWTVPAGGGWTYRTPSRSGAVEYASRHGVAYPTLRSLREAEAVLIAEAIRTGGAL